MKTENRFTITYNQIIDIILDMDTAAAIALWNEYTIEKAGFPDDAVYSFDDFNEIIGQKTPLEIACMISPSRRFNVSDGWWWMDAYGILESSPYPITDKNSIIDINSMVKYIVKNRDPLNNKRIAAALAEE